MSLLNYRVKFLLEKIVAFYLCHPGGEAEIGYDEFSFFINQQILRLNISMHNPIRMQVLNAFN